MGNVGRALASGVVLARLAACAEAPPGHPPGAARFAGAEYDVVMVYPASLRVSRGFDGGYFLPKR